MDNQTPTEQKVKLDFKFYDLDEQAQVFMASGLPVNPLPFLAGLFKGVYNGRVNGTDPEWIKTDQAKAILWIINFMAYGDMATIDTVEEWQRLHKIFKPQ